MLLAAAMVFGMAAMPAAADESVLIAGDYTIAAGGIYRLAAGMSGAIAVVTADPVTIIGSGEFHSGVFLDCTGQAGVCLTLQDVSIVNAERSLMDFSGTGNVLNFEGVNLLRCGAEEADEAAIHVGPAASLTIGGGGTIFLDHNGQGPAIGGNPGEVNGEIILAMTGNLEANASASLVGSGADAQGEAGAVRILSGSCVLTPAGEGYVNEEGQPVYPLNFNTAGLTAGESAFEIFADGGETPIYRGSLPAFRFNPQESAWIEYGDTGLYLYLTGEDHTLTVNGEEFVYYWDDITRTFDTVKRAQVSFCVDAENAELILSDGIGYTYLERTRTGYFLEAVEADEAAGIEAQPARTVYVLEPGEYSFTITGQGSYASSGSFEVSADGHAVSINETSNINEYLRDDVFTISMTPFIPSTNPGAWDGVTLDVSWYSAAARELHISTPAQLAGMAAIVNGIYNAETTAIIDDADGDGITETYTPHEYARLENRKIIAANSCGTTGSDNLVTTSTYWYGAKPEGTFISDELELRLPSDFNGQTVYLDCDLDMGGYQVDGVWTGARYMTIGGQSLMHYIDYSGCMSDGYSHIGSSFNGTLDGQGHLVKNIYCDRYATGSNYGDSVSVGLVGRLGNHDGDPAAIAAVNPTVRNVAVNGYIYGRRSVGGIVGKTGKTSASFGDGSVGAIIENCINFAAVSNTDAKGVGGICGAGWNSGEIRSCANLGPIYADRQNAGGICGSCEVPVINCYNAGYVNAVTYQQGQAIGTDNGGAVYTNVYWLTGSSIADSREDYSYPAVYRHDSRDALIEVSGFDVFTTEELLNSLNGGDRAWVFPAQTDAVSAVLEDVRFENCRLDTAGVSAAGFPVPRCFVSDEATVTAIEKLSDPGKLAYVAGQAFDPTGLRIQAVWSDGTTELITDYTVSIDHPLALTDTAVTVSGETGGMAYSYDFPITVTASELVGMEITAGPASVLYALGEMFDPAGMVVTAYYSADPSQGVALAEGAYTYTVEGSTVTVSYTEGAHTLTAAVALTILDTPAPDLSPAGSYRLASSNDLLWFANQVNALGRADLNAVVTADITADTAFPGIGTFGTKYAGHFDGQGHTLTLNMHIPGCAGLFAYVSGATIRNVTVAGVIENDTPSAGIAGIAGFVDTAPTRIIGCVNQAEIRGAGYAGGIAGKTFDAQLTISGCVNTGAVSVSDKYAGGIVGYLTADPDGGAGSLVCDCVNTGTVNADAGIAGGIAGSIRSAGADSSVTILRCGSDAQITGAWDVGGIAGWSQSSDDLICECRNLGAIRSTGSAINHGVGGIVGLAMGNVRGVYNHGAVCAEDEMSFEAFGAGGIIGTIDNHFVETNGITDAYSNGSISVCGSARAGALAGLIRCTSILDNCHYPEVSNAWGFVSEGFTVTGEPAAFTAETLMTLTLSDAFRAGEDGPVLAWETAVPGDINGDGAVDSDDAVYLLYHALFGGEAYPVHQRVDFDCSGAVSSDDAVYLLYHSLFGGEQYPIG